MQFIPTSHDPTPSPSRGLEPTDVGTSPGIEETAKLNGMSVGGIDHIAIAVKDLDSGLDFYCRKLGFKLNRKRIVKGTVTGMICAELQSGEIKIVLCEGTEPSSQVSMLVDRYGPGVAHVAISVKDIHASVALLKSRGVAFDTTVIEGAGLIQTFTARDANSGLSIELIQRSGNDGFEDGNVQELFDQLERSGKY